MSEGSEAVKKWRKNTKNRIVESMGGKCVICGYNKSTSALALHHINPEEKDKNVSRYRADGVSWSKIVLELKKCILVCSNCHCEIHSGEASVSENYSSFDENFTEYKELRKDSAELCSVCGNKKPDGNVTCSKTCALRKRSKINWDVFDTLLEREVKNKTSWIKISEMIGDISDVGVKKRAKKLGLVK